MQVNMDRVGQVREIIKKRKISDLLKSLNKFGDPEYRGHEIMIKCPFHEDISPSFGINDFKGTCHCFSCGAGGDYIKIFSQLYAQAHLTKLGYYEAVEMLLRTDDALSSVLPFMTIYEDTLISVTTDFKRNSFRPTVKPMTLLALSSKLRASGKTDYDSLALAQALLLKNTTPDEIYSLIVNSEDAKVENVPEIFTAEDLLKGVLW